MNDAHFRSYHAILRTDAVVVPVNPMPVTGEQDTTSRSSARRSSSSAGSFTVASPHSSGRVAWKL